MRRLKFPKPRFAPISLAAKCRILFGLAVLLIVLSALYVPWLRTRDLVHETNMNSARQMALLAAQRCDLQASGEWSIPQGALERWWRRGAGSLGLYGSCPRLVQLSPKSPMPPPGADAFLRTGINTLLRNAGERETTQIDSNANGEPLYRYLLAIRSNGERQPQGTLLGVVMVDYVAPDARFDLLTNLGIMAMSAALAFILATLVFYLITNKLILRPVRELRQVAEQVSAGNHDVRSTIATGDEFEDLARAVNAMLAHLETSRLELETINRSLDTRLGELAELNVRLFEANKLKNHFLANVSHELRTPLTSIIGFAELLRESHLTDGGRSLRYSENILSSGRMLLAIINDLLDLAKIEAGKLELHIGAVNLRDMADALIDFMQPLAMKKKLILVADVADDIPTVQSDSGRIQQVLYNLLSNAVKFTDEGGRVELRITHPERDRVRLTVTDTGVGIPADKLERIFDSFVQLDGSVTREHSGTGLGLTITREIVQLLGGTITATSEVGRGSVFTVTLSIAPPHDDAPASRLTGSISLS